jgi:hypothetical protein
VTLESNSSWLLGLCLLQLRKSCAGTIVTFPRAERVFILGHFFALESFAAACEAFNNVYPDREVPYKTAIHRFVTKFQVFVCVTSTHWETKQLILRSHDISRNNSSLLLLVSLLCALRFHESRLRLDGTLCSNTSGIRRNIKKAGSVTKRES